ncbi:MAG: CTP synthase [Gammaproteobacteria bacterium]|nr:CTP synthase [Gammaproteobacteria bacterium]
MSTYSSNHTRLIFVTGGVLSSLGKGVFSASLAKLLQVQGLNVSLMKIDPYLNLDSGTISPFQHGEVFVTRDGAETDLDLGTYERFLEKSLSKRNHITAGAVFQSVIERERKGDYLGATVQIIPHITDEIKRRILDHDHSLDVMIVEVGGTVGDIESQPFLEAIRQLRYECPSSLCIHMTLVPYLDSSGELKTKPTQHSVKELRSIGLNPDLIVCRSMRLMSNDERQKIALFSNLPHECIFESPSVSSIYELPIFLEKQGILDVLSKKFGFAIPTPAIYASELQTFLERMKNPHHEIKIGVVGKYTTLTDAYKSITESLLHAATRLHAKAQVTFIDSEELEQHPENIGQILSQYDGILVAGGFGSRGVEGKIATAQWCRLNHMPYFGICLGMQIAVIEYCRHVLHYADATSAEFNPSSPHKIFMLMTEWIDMNQQQHQRNENTWKGGTMRLGHYPCTLTPGSKAHAAYQAEHILERHRHRYEMNPIYSAELHARGCLVVGRGTYDLVEVIELQDHPWFIGVQYHPEFESSPAKPHPLFVGFIDAALKKNQA